MRLNQTIQLFKSQLCQSNRLINQPLIPIYRTLSTSLPKFEEAETTSSANLLSSLGSTFNNRNFDAKSIKNKLYESNESSYSHILNVHCSLNNTILTLCDSNNKVICTASAGSAGFRKAQRSGFEAAYQAAVLLVNKANEKRQNVTDLLVKFKGFGPGREAVFRSIRSNTNWAISRITDTTPIPHNGCRPPKPRRL